MFKTEPTESTSRPSPSQNVTSSNHLTTEIQSEMSSGRAAESTTSADNISVSSSSNDNLSTRTTQSFTRDTRNILTSTGTPELPYNSSNTDKRSTHTLDTVSIGSHSNENDVSVTTKSAIQVLSVTSKSKIAWIVPVVVCIVLVLIGLLAVCIVKVRRKMRKVTFITAPYSRQDLSNPLYDNLLEDKHGS